LLRADIRGFGRLRVEHLVLDFNGTLAADGRLLDGVKARLAKLARSLRIHVVTADTFGKACASLRGVDCSLEILRPGSEDRAKARYVRRLGARAVVASGTAAMIA
jgi:soluble P-type ATPase